MWMMLPRPRSRMRGATVLVSTKAPTGLIRSTSAKSAALISSRAERTPTAPSFTMMPTPPYSLRAAPTSFATSASLPTSPLTAMAAPPALVMAVTVSASGSDRRPKTTTCAPSLAKSSAVARPMPVPPPATMATLPSSVAMNDAPAEGLHGTGKAPRLPRRAPGGAEVHEGLIVVIGASGGNERFREGPNGLVPAKLLEPARAEEDAAEDAAHVGVHEGGVLAVGEGEDGPRRVASDPRHAPESGPVVGEPPRVADHRLARDAVQAAHAAVVAARPPGPRHFPRAGLRELCEGGIAREELVILGDDPAHLRLLEHDLGDEHAVGLARAAPREVATVVGIPAEEAAVKGALRRRVRELHGGHCVRELSASQVDFPAKHVTMGPCPPIFP